MDELTRRALVDRVANIIADYNERELSETEIDDLNGDELDCIMECLQYGQHVKKGGTEIEMALHDFMQEDYSNAVGAVETYGYRAFYHESGLYSVRNIKHGMVCLLYASNPHDAIEKAKTYFKQG